MLRDDVHALGEAERIGYPVLIKPSAGGGGKGMRMVRTPRELESALQVCRSEAKAAFGDDSLYLEKWLDENRHVEVQVAVDRYGHGVHLGERDCSVQRRHQKILEEAPTPALSTRGPGGPRRAGDPRRRRGRLRERRHARVPRRPRRQRSTSSRSTAGSRWSTRSPRCSPASTSSRPRSGSRPASRSGFSQADVAFRGHAIEFRINAEDPRHDFRPGAGVVERYHAPGGPGVRMDSHLYAGYEVPPFYDSLLGKLIVWGPDRATAIARGRVALDELVVDGIVTNVAIHQALLGERDVPRGPDDDQPARPRRRRGLPGRGRPLVSAGRGRPARSLRRSADAAAGHD